MLHGQVQTGGRFAASAHADQYDIGFFQVCIFLAIIMGKTEIDGFNSVVVNLAFTDV